MNWPQQRNIYIISRFTTGIQVQMFMCDWKIHLIVPLMIKNLQLYTFKGGSRQKSTDLNRTAQQNALNLT